jgi:hypothetical protein
MTKLDDRTAVNMDVALEEACRALPHGGGHETRKHIAQKLMQSAKKGNVTLDGLRNIASRALSELSDRKSAEYLTFGQATSAHRPYTGVAGTDR